MDKTHYRKALKSDHLGIADLEEYTEEGKRLVFTIREVKQYILKDGDRNSGISVAGKRISANIAYFKEPIKPLVLNATNSRIIRAFNGNSPFIEDWSNTLVELYIDSSIKMKGEVVGGVRIKPKQPVLAKPELLPNTGKWNDAVTFLKNNGDIANIKKHYTLSANNEKTLKDEAKI